MNKTILITGASSGIGKATAIHFQEKGWNVAATMRSPDKATDLENLENLITLPLDVTDHSSIQEAIGDTIENFNSLDVIVNNAGYALIGPFEASTEEQIQRQFNTNVFGLMAVTRAILPYFRERKEGIIINVASVGGRITVPLYSLYQATKWAVEGFSESLQHELYPLNVKIKIIEPGLIETDFYRRSMEIMSAEGLTAYDDYVNRALPRLQDSGEQGSSPEEIAKLIHGAANDKSWRLRYSGGKHAKMALFLRRILPDGAFNGFVRRQFAK